MLAINKLIKDLHTPDRRHLARSISMVENEAEGYSEFLKKLKPDHSIPVTGFTGPPGAGKSSLINLLLEKLSLQNKKIAVIAIDPTSPFNYGALLGDRIRMNQHANDPDIFIRSLATRGALGGLSVKTIETVDILKSAGFDHIFIETVGVGQSEVEVAGLADTTIVVLVPESGDQIQMIKSGLMEVADIFVVNKADRADAAKFVSNLNNILHANNNKESEIPVIPTSVTEKTGLDQLLDAINKHLKLDFVNKKKLYLLTEKVYRLIQHNRMKDVSKDKLLQSIENEIQKNKNFNIYQYAEKF